MCMVVFSNRSVLVEKLVYLLVVLDIGIGKNIKYGLKIASGVYIFNHFTAVFLN